MEKRLEKFCQVEFSSEFLPHDIEPGIMVTHKIFQSMLCLTKNLVCNDFTLVNKIHHLYVPRFWSFFSLYLSFYLPSFQIFKTFEIPTPYLFSNLAKNFFLCSHLCFTFECNLTNDETNERMEGRMNAAVWRRVGQKIPLCWDFDAFWKPGAAAATDTSGPDPMEKIPA